MNNELYKEIIENYVSAYNHFDTDGMLSHMHNEVRFENISNGEITLSTNGLIELRNQAEQAKHLSPSNWRGSYFIVAGI